MAFKALSDVSGGLKGGRSWVQSFDGDSWPLLMKHAVDTIIKIEPADLIQKQGTMQEATDVIFPNLAEYTHGCLGKVVGIQFLGSPHPPVETW